MDSIYAMRKKALSGLVFRDIYGPGLVFILCFLLIIAVFAPRFLGYAVPVTGLLAGAGFRCSYGFFPPFSPRIVLLLGVPLLLAGLSVLWSIVPEESFEKFLKISGVFLGGGMLLHVAASIPASDIMILRRFFWQAFLVAVCLCIFELYSHGYFHRLFQGGSSEDFNLYDLNRSVILITLALFPLLAVLRQEKRAKSMIIIGLLVLAMFWKTESQSSHLCFLLGMTFMFLFPYKRQKAWPALAGIVALALLLFPWVAQALFDFFPPLVSDLHWFQSSYAIDRLEIWDFVARYSLENPLYGFGLHTTRFITDFETARLYHPSDTVMHPHNFIAQLWLEFGVLGPITAAALFFSLITLISRQTKTAQRIMLPTFVAMLSVASTAYGFWQGWWLGTFFFMAALSILTARVLDQSECE